MKYETIGAKVLDDIKRWRRRSITIRAQEYAALGEDHVKAGDLISDFIDTCEACTMIEELGLQPGGHELVGKITSRCTAVNLQALGYDGSRSTTGLDITPLYTVILYRTKRKFPGEVVVRLAKGSFESINYRGIRNRTDVRDYFCTELNALVLKLLAQAI